MKTSSKLLIGFVVFLLASVFVMLALAKYELKKIQLGNGIKEVEKRPLKDFHSVDISGNANVILTQGPEFKFEIKGDQNLLPEVLSEVEEGKLKVTLPNSHNKARFDILITAPSYQSIELTRGVIAKTSSNIQAPTLALSMNTGSQGEFQFDVKALNFEGATGCEVKLKGKADNAFLKASTGCVVDAVEFPIRKCKVEGSTGVEFEVYALDKLDVELNMGSKLRYKGKPEVHLIKNSMGASVEPMN